MAYLSILSDSSSKKEVDMLGGQPTSRKLKDMFLVDPDDDDPSDGFLCHDDGIRQLIREYNEDKEFEEIVQEMQLGEERIISEAFLRACAIGDDDWREEFVDGWNDVDEKATEDAEREHYLHLSSLNSPKEFFSALSFLRKLRQGAERDSALRPIRARILRNVMPVINAYKERNPWIKNRLNTSKKK